MILDVTQGAGGNARLWSRRESRFNALVSMPHYSSERPRPDLSLHLLGEQAILLDPVAQKIYRLNASAAFVWGCLEQGSALYRVQESLQKRFRLSADDADTFVRGALAEWSDLGLLQSELRAAPHDRPIRYNESPAVQPAQAAQPNAVLPKHGHVVMYRLLDSSIAICSSSANGVHEAHAPFRHLASEMVAEPSIALELVQVREGYRLVSEGQVLDTCPAAPQIAPMFKLALTQLALRECRASAAVHAAAVRRNGRAILLVGPAGSGKTTLAAGLMLDGSQSLADDTTVLSEDGASVRPLPMPLCIKRGAWPVLGRLMPEFERLPVHRRADGQDVRYIAPSACAADSTAHDAAQIGTIVFPRYSSGAECDARRIAPLEAFEALLPEFYPLANRFDSGTLDLLTRLLTDVACIRLTYGDLRAGVNAIQELAC